MKTNRERKKLEILIVEDSQTQAEQLKRMLEVNNYNVKHAFNGRKALEILEIFFPDLIISDIVMPEINGYELCSRIKQDAMLKHIPVILLTSLSDPEEIFNGLKCGADDFFVKPFKEDSFISRINKLVSYSIKKEDASNLQEVEIFLNGKKHIITANQSQVLTLLLSTYEAAVKQNKHLLGVQEELKITKENLEELVEKRTIELKESQEKYFDLYNNAPAMLLSVETANGRVVDCNDTLLKKTGFERKEVIGIPVFSLFPTGYPEQTNRIRNVFLKTGELKNSEIDLFTASGSMIPVLINATAVKDEKGKVLYSRIVVQDISAMKVVQKELIKAKEKAEESDTLKSAFLANMSHEIRTPLNGMVGFSQLIKDPGIKDEEKEDCFNTLDQCSQQLLQIVNDIIDISKIEAGQETVQPVAFKLSSLSEEIQLFFHPLAVMKNLTFDLKNEIPDNQVNIIIDPSKLRKTLNNIISNAIKFTDSGGVSIDISKTDNNLFFKIKDSGIGIHPAYHKVIFDRFRQVEMSDTRRYGGTGLGLSLAKSYVELLGGTIKLDSSLGCGSIFTITVPYVSAGIQEEVKTKIYSSVSGWNKKTILLAEDEVSNALVITSMLKSTGVNIILAANGVEAVEYCRNDLGISLVLMDIKMPEMDGLTATRIIKSFRKDLPVIATTAYALHDDRKRCIEAGCNDYISKPICKEELINLAGKYLVQQYCEGNR